MEMSRKLPYSMYVLIRKNSRFLDVFVQTNPDDVVTVGFANVGQANACCQYMSGRIWHRGVIQCQNYDGKTSSFLFEWLQSELFLGSTKYDVVASNEEEEKERIDEWHRYLNEEINRTA